MKKKLCKNRKNGLLFKTLFLLLLAAGLFVLVFFGINRFNISITLLGESNITLEAGDEYSDQGAKAVITGSIFLKEGKELQVRARGKVDPLKPDTYEITYKAAYLFINESLKRTVTVQDTTPPTIELVEDSYANTLPGEEYKEAGYTAIDNLDGDLTDKVERVEENGYVYYTVTDSAGNTATAQREIVYCDPYPPELTLEGPRDINITAGHKYNEPGYTATDNLDGDLTDKVIVEGEVDIYTPDTYTLSYSVMDEAGNGITLTRKVCVTAEPQKDGADTGKYIYLTFDDGPSAHTEELLGILDNYNVKATFFVIDTGYTELIGDMHRAGHSVGIHTASHDFKKIYKSEDAYFKDLEKMHRIILENGGPETKLIRFPGGSSNTVSSFNRGIMTRLSAAVEEKGYVYFDWNVDSNDAGGASEKNEVFNNVIDGISGKDNAVVLQHDTHGFSVDAVEKIIIWGLAEGYTFLPLNENSPTAHHGINN